MSFFRTLVAIEPAELAYSGNAIFQRDGALIKLGGVNFDTPPSSFFDYLHSHQLGPQSNIRTWSRCRQFAKQVCYRNHREELPVPANLTDTHSDHLGLRQDRLA